MIDVKNVVIDKKANEHVHMNQRLNALVGQTMFFSNNFLVKGEA